MQHFHRTQSIFSKFSETFPLPHPDRICWPPQLGQNRISPRRSTLTTLQLRACLSTHSTWWVSTDTSESGWPVPRFWTFVFGQEICIPRTEAAFWKDDRLSAADWDDVANKVVLSAYTRSVNRLYIMASCNMFTCCDCIVSGLWSPLRTGG